MGFAVLLHRCNEIARLGRFGGYFLCADAARLLQ